MQIFKYLILTVIILVNIQHAYGNGPWDIVLMDVSSDMEAYGKNNVTELYIADHCIKHLADGEMPDSIMFFAGGRTILPVGDLSDRRYEYSDILKIIGDGTSINDALASCLGIAHKAGRILVISNGREVGSSMSSNTLSKLMKSKGIRVDAIIVSVSCDSIYVKSAFNPNDSVRYKRTGIYSGLKNIVNRTGGKIVTIEREGDIDNTIIEFLSAVTNENTSLSKDGCNLNAELTNRLLARIKPQEIQICEVDTNVVITYRGIKHHGLSDILNVAKLNPYILVNQDVNRDCGDAKPLNIVFISDPSARNRKQLTFNQFKLGDSYCKLRQDTPIDILPMIYYSGTGNKMLLCGLEYEEE